MLADFTFSDQITCVLELNSVNRRSAWQQAIDAFSTDYRYVLVATTRQVKLLAVKRDAIYGQLVVQETNLTALDQGPIKVMVEFEKTGRVFYGRDGGRVSELTFENTENEARKVGKTNLEKVSQIAQSYVLGQRKRLYRVDH